MRGVEFASATDGCRIAYRVDGPVYAPPVLLCSMGTAAMPIWDSVVEGLCDSWRIIRHDRRGDGESDIGHPESHNFQTYVLDALAVLDHCGCIAANVCGMAFGARVALHLARDSQMRVRKLILFDATGGPPAPLEERQAGSRAALELRTKVGLPTVHIQKEWFARRDSAAVGLSVNALKGQPDWMPGLERIGVPTLVACGDHDPNLEGSRRIAREIPRAQFALMPMTGHASLLERPDLVLNLLKSFLCATGQ